MPLAIPCQDDFDGATFTQRAQAMLASDEMRVAFTPRPFSAPHVLEATLTPRAFVHVDATGAAIRKAFDGDMIDLSGPLIPGYGAGYCEWHGGWLEGAGETFAGGIFRIVQGGMQKISGVQANRSRGPCLAFAAPGAGAGCIVSNSGFQRHDHTLPAIVLPDLDPATAGLRDFINLRGGGGYLIALRGGSTVRLDGCDWMEGPAEPMFTANTRNVTVMRCRPLGLRLAGSGHIVTANTIGIYLDGSNDSYILKPGTTHVRGHRDWNRTSGNVADLSGNATNVF